MDHNNYKLSQFFYSIYDKFDYTKDFMVIKKKTKIQTQTFVCDNIIIIIMIYYIYHECKK